MLGGEALRAEAAETQQRFNNDWKVLLIYCLIPFSAAAECFSLQIRLLLAGLSKQA